MIMNMMSLILDVAPVGGPIGVVAAVGFFLVFIAVAYIAFRLLKKTVKMAVRIAVVLVILAIAVIGSLSLLWFGSGGTPRPRPAPTRTH